MAEYVPRCDVCGDDGSHRGPLTLTFRPGEQTCYCPPCERLVEAGLLRPETVEGELRFRQWRMGEWTPGDLLPAPGSAAPGS